MDEELHCFHKKTLRGIAFMVIGLILLLQMLGILKYLMSIIMGFIGIIFMIYGAWISGLFRWIGDSMRNK